MPLGYRFDGRWVTIECPGHYSVEDFCANVEAAIADSRWPGDPLVLFDLSDRSPHLGRTRADEITIAHCLGRFAEAFGGRYAVVAPHDIHYGAIRVAAVDMKRFGIEVFVGRTEEEAREWLLRGDGGAA